MSEQLKQKSQYNATEEQLFHFVLIFFYFLNDTNLGGTICVCVWKYFHVQLLVCPFLTQVTDVLSELLEGGAEAFRVGHDFRGVHHKGHTVDLFIQAWPLHIAHSLRAHWLIWAKLGERNDKHFPKNNSFSEDQRMTKVLISMTDFTEFYANPSNSGRETFLSQPHGSTRRKVRGSKK